MCLAIDRNKKSPPKKRYAWKVVWYDMTPLYMYSIRKYKLGQWYNSTRENKFLSNCEIIYKRVDLGIHVYLTREAAREYKNGNEAYLIIKVEVNPKDWVASGRNQAVYTRVKPIAIVH